MSNLTKSFEKLSLPDRINFARHLSIIVKSGLPVVEGLKIIKRQVSNKLLLRIIDTLVADVNNGRFLSDSLKQFRHIFGDFFISIVQVGESSGTLADNLLYLADEMKKSQELRSRVKSAMIYPAILMFMTLAVTSFLTFFIFPKLMGAFASMNVKMPAPTYYLMATLGFIKTYYWLIMILAIVLYIGMKMLMRFRIVKYGMDRFMLMVPVLSGLVSDVNIANITRVLYILLKSGMRIVESLSITSETLDNLVYKESIVRSEEGVRRGEQLAALLAMQKTYFPPIMTSMVEIGENTGNLEENLLYLSTYYTEEVDNSLKNFVAIIEPLILIFMGLLVGYVAIAIIIPIYSISQNIAK